MSTLRGDGVTVDLGGTRIVDGADLHVGPGEWLSIVGPNGAGKSTLLRAVLGLVDAAGTITVDGVDVSELTPRERARRLAYLPQAPSDPPGMRVIDYVLLGITPRLGVGAWPGPAEGAEALAALAGFGLDGLADRQVSSLSGGERQLTLVARALVQQASVLVLDEPTTALDLGHQQDMLAAIDHLRADRGVAVIVTMHDLSLAADRATEVMMLADGRVVARGDATAVLQPERIRRHYGADVDVVTHDGRLVVIPAAGRR